MKEIKSDPKVQILGFPPEETCDTCFFKGYKNVPTVTRIPDKEWEWVCKKGFDMIYPRRCLIYRKNLSTRVSDVLEKIFDL